ncbi:DNA invertase Pin-like site-specific DNA recombinase [Mycetocola sp. CAN_C7]|uniref:recombinase family protein n=1 Tax=Mycetocola sp. CAN_C7 TaxID=2787724 RepID=UPI001A32026D
MAFDSTSNKHAKQEDSNVNTVIGYTRVSTEEQGRSGLGLEAQRATISAHANAKGWEVVWVTDEGMSAKSLDRPGLQDALRMLKRHEADAILVAKLDRLSRSVQDFAGLLEVAKKQRWSITALDVGVDTTTSGGELVANVMAAVAQWERRTIGERTSVALKAAQARGVHVGRPAALSKSAESRLHELRASGLSFAKVAAHLNNEGVPTAHGGKAWHPTTVARILKRQEIAA